MSTNDKKQPTGERQINKAAVDARDLTIQFVKLVQDGKFKEINDLLPKLSNHRHYILAFSEAFHGAACDAFWDESEIVNIYDKAKGYHHYCLLNNICYLR